MVAVSKKLGAGLKILEKKKYLLRTKNGGGGQTAPSRRRTF
jgi:hypothetical protein